MLMMSDDPPKERGRHRVKVENQMIRKREREFRHQQMWTGAESYYKRWDNINHRIDEWTSPRYYEENNKMLADMRLKRDKEELLIKRRENLKKLLEQEQNSYQIEMMVKKSLAIKEQSPRPVPTEVLKDVNIELKKKEEEKRKREAELKLYHQWRINNPIVRQFESKYRFKDLKLSWLDQQIEKRMQKENEEQECQKIIKEQEARIQEERLKEEQIRKENAEKEVKLKEYLDKQVEELKSKQKLSDQLKKQEIQEEKHKRQLTELECLAKEEEKKRQAKEIALFNIKQHKMKLKQRAIDVQEALKEDQELILRMKRLEMEDLIADTKKRNEIKQGLKEFLDIVKDQQELEKHRQKHLDFIFDSEAKAIYDKQLEMWKKEELARKKLLKQVLDTVNKQVQENLEKNKKKQMEVLREREEMLAKIEQYNQELVELRQEEAKKHAQKTKMREAELKLNKLKKKHEEHNKLKEIDEELERVRREEERLQKEILEIQRRQGPIRPRTRTRIF
ncbi:trichoplein keratin filament-binding protein isoform X1 [Anthonomus grandis grandis]|uniref:trichoplein keratin filament-binding protein isoform X1 n=1 Tax=Anthonomus grandis grandis TaxID=2921223 RepID=UPI0021655484|nr:trichoplein keratin filament-binding protein isoform X1 [Anthonomus grandis grandis]